MPAAIWTERRPGETISSTHGWCSEGEHATVIDPSLSPNLLRMPDAEGIPEHLRGAEVRVECSAWLGCAFHPTEGWVDQRTRWHLLAVPGDLAAQELVGVGWVVVGIGPRRAGILRELAGGRT